MKKPFNPNLNIDLFKKFDSLQEVVDDVSYINTNTSNYAKQQKGKNFSDLMSKKYSEFAKLTPKPLTKEEKELFDKTFLEVMSDESKLRHKIDSAEVAILDSMKKRGVEYSLRINKNKKLKRASKRFFGESKSEITFEDYKKALKRKKELEKYESSSLMENIED